MGSRGVGGGGVCECAICSDLVFTFSVSYYQYFQPASSQRMCVCVRACVRVCVCVCVRVRVRA